VPPISMEKSIVTPTVVCRITAIVGNGVFWDMVGDVHEVGMDKSIGVNIDVPIVLHLLREFIDLEFLIGDRPILKFSLFDDIKVRPDLFGIMFDQRESQISYFWGIAIDIEREYRLFDSLLPHKKISFLPTQGDNPLG